MNEWMNDWNFRMRLPIESDEKTCCILTLMNDEWMNESFNQSLNQLTNHSINDGSTICSTVLQRIEAEAMLAHIDPTAQGCSQRSAADEVQRNSDS